MDLPQEQESARSATTSDNENSLCELDSLCRMCAQPCKNDANELRAVPLTDERSHSLKLYLKIDVGNDSELLPRQLCQACAYALERWSEIMEIVKKSEVFFNTQLDLRGVKIFNNLDQNPSSTSSENEDMLECAKCSKKFPDFSTLVVHELGHLPKIEGKECQKRRRRATRDTDLQIEESTCQNEEDQDDGNYESVPKKASGIRRNLAAKNSLTPLFSCNHCNENFDTLDTLIHHLGSLDPDESLSCSLCNHKFNSMHQLVEHTRQHLRLQTNQVRVFDCSQCSKGPFTTRASLQKHLKQIHLQPKREPAVPFPCGLCSLGFDEFVDFSKHVQTHVNFRHFPCAICGCRFTKVPYLLEHVIQHSNGSAGRQITFMCEICPNQVFSSKHNLASHMTKKHRPKTTESIGRSINTAAAFFASFPEQTGLQIECGLCEEILSSCQSLADHVADQHAKFKHIVCKKCQCKFTKLPYYLEHVAEHVANPDKVLSVACEACSEIFSSKHNLSKHIYKKHRNSYPQKQKEGTSDLQKAAEEPEQVKFKVERNPKTRLFHCQNCSQTFKNASQLNSHLVEHVPNKCSTCQSLFECREELKLHLLENKCKREEKFPCPICGKLLASKQSMRIHTSLHSSERKFVCEVCAKSYRTQSALVSHRNVVHLHKSQFMCHICARTFSFKLALKRHVMLHVGDLPHRCSTCDKAFVTANLLKIHTAKEHERRVQHFCTSCKKGFVDVIGLRRHMRMVCKVPECAIPYIRDRQFVKHSIQTFDS